MSAETKERKANTIKKIVCQELDVKQSAPLYKMHFEYIGEQNANSESVYKLDLLYLGLNRDMLFCSNSGFRKGQQKQAGSNPDCLQMLHLAA